MYEGRKASESRKESKGSKVKEGKRRKVKEAKERK